MPMTTRRIIGCNPGIGCFSCPFKDCVYDGNRSREEANLFTGSHKVNDGHGYMTKTHQRNGHNGHR